MRRGEETFSAIVLCLYLLWLVLTNLPKSLLYVAGVGALFVLLKLAIKLYQHYRFWSHKCEHGVLVNRPSIGPCPRCDAQRVATERRIAAERAEQERQRTEQERQRAEQERQKQERLRRLRQEALDRVHQLEHLKKMPHYSFELFTCEVYSRLGWEASPTPASGDSGIDGILKRPGVKAILQCKRYSKGPVGEPALRDLLGAVAKEKANLGILVTTSTFTTQAIEWQKGTKKICLVDGEELLTMVKEAFKGATELRAVFGFTQESENATPVDLCPSCGKAIRLMRKGYTEFLACTICEWTDPEGMLQKNTRRKRRRRRYRFY